MTQNIATQRLDNLEQYKARAAQKRQERIQVSTGRTHPGTHAIVVAIPTIWEGKRPLLRWC